jgi:hypothetical protein
MKRILLLLFSFLFAFAYAQDLLVENIYNSSFKKAYVLNPTVPKGILEAVAFTQTRFQHINSSTEESCMGYPRTYGIMGLVQDGKNYFRNNLSKVAQLSGFSETAIQSSAENSILAFASAFSKLQRNGNIFSQKMEDYIPILIELSELPLSNDLQNDFKWNTSIYNKKKEFDAKQILGILSDDYTKEMIYHCFLFICFPYFSAFRRNWVVFAITCLSAL